MYGSIIGDLAGSPYEWNPIKTKDFPLFSKECTFTDDTVTTIAVAEALLEYKRGQNFKKSLVKQLQRLGRAYPDRDYGTMYYNWLLSDNPRPYNSFGNGSAMRVGPVGLFARSLEEALALSKESAEVTHNHPEGIKGAQAVSAAVYLAKTGSQKDYISRYIDKYFYPMNFTLSEIRESYEFDVTCQGSVPQAIKAFLESTSFTDALRNAISLGGDADTLACICGSIAYPFYLVQNRLQLDDDLFSAQRVYDYLPIEFLGTIRWFEEEINPYREVEKFLEEY